MTNLAAVAILVEGADDCHFFRQYIRHLNYGDLLFDGEIKSPDRAGKRVMVCETGGDGALIGKKGVSKYVLQAARASNKVLIIADADKGDIGKRREKFADASQEIEDETGADTDVFLLPDNKSAGMLETLLVAIFRGSAIIECFEHYEDCLRDKKLRLPDPKGKVYAYYGAYKEKPKKEKGRDYSDPKLWNLEHPALLPLRNFLLESITAA